MKDKSLNGIKEELKLGLPKAAIFFSQTYGIPLEIFNDWLKKLGGMDKQLLWYMNFRNQHPKLFQ